MDQVRKLKAVHRKSLDLAAEMELINRYALKELTPDEVYAFSVVLCDNDIDRDGERFDAAGLEKLAKLFVGKTGIFNHSWDANDQVARIYRTGVEKTGERTALGEERLELRAYAYILRTPEMKSVIDKIEGGILKEVSVGVAVEECACSICGKSLRWGECENGHEKGKTYEGRLCYGLLKNPLDAYEFSFVAVPAQRGAGVTKGYQEDAEKAIELLLAADLRPHMKKLDELEQRIGAARLEEKERQERQGILLENIKFLEEKQNGNNAV